MTSKAVHVLCSFAVCVGCAAGGLEAAEAPSMEWCRIWGSTNYDFPCGLVCDSEDSVYAQGCTRGGFHGQPHAGKEDLCLTKYDSRGARRPPPMDLGPWVRAVYSWPSSQVTAGDYGRGVGARTPATMGARSPLTGVLPSMLRFRLASDRFVIRAEAGQRGAHRRAVHRPASSVDTRGRRPPKALLLAA